MVAGAILPDAARYLDVSQVEKGRVRPQQILGQRQANLGPACPAMWLNVHANVLFVSAKHLWVKSA